MDLHLSGKTAVVTGASRGIGLAVTKALVATGAHVVAGSRTPGKELPLLEESGQVSFVSVDLTRPGAAEELIAATTHRGGIDVLINNVGGATGRPGGFASVSDDEWQASWELNMMGVVRPTRAARRRLDRHRQLDQRLPSHPECLRLLCRQGRRRQLCQGIVKRTGAEEYSCQFGQPGPGVDRAVDGAGRGGRGVGRGSRSDGRRGQVGASKRRADGTVQHSRRSRRPGCLPGQRPRRKHHRIRLPHRWWIRHHRLIANPPSARALRRHRPEVVSRGDAWC
jgi:NAD(P)-dependent dehydrogenase (short-subunit alcohol dehydrogenase family)